MRLFGMTPSPATALVLPSGEALSYAWLLDAIDDLAAKFDRGGLVTIVGDRSLECLLAYLAALSAGQTVAWLRPADDEALRAQVAAFSPDYVIGVPGEEWTAAGLRVPVLVRHRERSLDGTTSLLLSTSGSTGGPRFVRLSLDAVQANARAIADALALDPRTRSVTSLPLHYTYGLSVVNSTLAAGGSLVLDSTSPTSLRFWRQVARHEVTHVAAVPFHVHSLLTTRPALLRTPPLRLVTVSGGTLPPDDVTTAASLLAEAGAGLALMYGMTEATARVTVLPPDEASARPESVGLPVPGTRVTVEDENGPVPDGELGRIVVRGPGVMLGYATSRADLDAPGTLDGVLRTSDRGYLREGRLYVRGRVDRTVKLAGLRVELDELERLFADLGPAAAVGVHGDRAAVFVEHASDEQVRSRLSRVCRRLGVTAGVVTAHARDRLPRLPNGKVDYVTLTGVPLTAPGTRGDAS
ncbi:MAG: AMP-binding protein [Saccharothrix sp.]|nr:AMP-binding protein [Saccharothrix sp.]